MKHLVAGHGEIGKSVGAVLGGYEWVDIGYIPDGTYDMLHVCFPYSEDFVDNVLRYMETYQTSYVVVYSTVPIGTTAKIPGAVHSPVEGKHPELEFSIRIMERWVGYNDESTKLVYRNLFDSLGLKVRMVDSSDYTEALKLLSTTEYGVNIEFARYKKHVADSIGMDYELTKEWNAEYNKLYRNLGMADRFQKYVLDAPEGPKGGHCVTPNAVLLDAQFPNELVKIVSEQ